MRTMLNLRNSAVFLGLMFFLLFLGCKKQENVNGFFSASGDLEIIEYDGKKNVIKTEAEPSKELVRYSLNKYKGKTIIIHFSADFLRTGSKGALIWRDQNNLILQTNAPEGLWQNMKWSHVTTPAENDPFLFLTSIIPMTRAGAPQTNIYISNPIITIYELKTIGEDGNIYVSANNGTDSGNGTKVSPFREIALAMQCAKPGDTVLVDSGTYYGNFKIPSGTEGKPVTLTALPGAEVIITPAIPITPQWSHYNENIYAADISEYISLINIEFPQLFADRDSMVEARYPNMGASMSTIMDYKRDVAQRGTNKNTVVASRNIPSGIEGSRLVIWPGEDGRAGWAAFESPILSVNSRTIRLEKELTAPLYDGGDSNTPHPGNPFYITGALSLLDSPGEYYFDKQTNLLYFYPPWNGSPDLRTLTMRHFSSTAITAGDTSYVNIKNIIVYGGGINMRNVNNNIIENCRVNYAEHFYNSGWVVQKDSKITNAMIVTGNNNRISGCEFGPTAGNGILLKGDDNIFTNNIVHTTGYSGNYVFGVDVFDSKRLEISHNTFLDTSKAHVYFHEFAYERCIIRNNYFENHSVLSSDASPVYTGTSGTDAGGTEIYHNFIVCGDKGDNGTLTHLRDGLYIDNNNSNFIVRHNIVIGGHSGLRINIPNDGTRFHNNTVIGAHYGIGFYTNTLHKADASRVTVLDNLFVNIKSHNISYWGTENGKSVNYNGDFVNGTIPVTVRTEGRMQSSGNARGTVDAQYRPTGRTPDIGAIPRNGQMFAYGADWKLGERK